MIESDMDMRKWVRQHKGLVQGNFLKNRLKEVVTKILKKIPKSKQKCGLKSQAIKDDFPKVSDDLE